MENQQPLNKAIALIQAGDEAQGALILINYLRQNPQSETGWLWMTNVVKEIDARLDCLEKALQINPHNQYALQMRAKLQQYKASQAQPANDNDQDNSPAQTPVAPITSLKPDEAEDDISPEAFINILKSIGASSTETSLTNKANNTHQNLKLGLIGGFLGMLLGAGIWGILSLLTGQPLAYIVLIVGLITGITVRVMGQSNQVQFGLIGGALTTIGCILGAYVYLVPNSGTLGPAIVLPQLSTQLNSPTILLWVLTIFIGFLLSFYRSSTKQLKYRDS